MRRREGAQRHCGDSPGGAKQGPGVAAPQAAPTSAACRPHAPPFASQWPAVQETGRGNSHFPACGPCSFRVGGQCCMARLLRGGTVIQNAGCARPPPNSQHCSPAASAPDLRYGHFWSALMPPHLPPANRCIVQPRPRWCNTLAPAGAAAETLERWAANDGRVAGQRWQALMQESGAAARPPHHVMPRCEMPCDCKSRARRSAAGRPSKELQTQLPDCCNRIVAAALAP